MNTDLILHLAAKAYNAPLPDLLSGSRKRACVYARAAVIRLLRERTDLELAEIGCVVGLQVSVVKEHLVKHEDRMIYRDYSEGWERLNVMFDAWRAAA